MSLILSGTDGLSDVDGTVSTPAIRGTDSNTGIFFPAADTIAFTEGGVESMRIDSSGRVLIGSSSSVGNSNANNLELTNSAGSGVCGLTLNVNSGSANTGNIYWRSNASNNAIQIVGDPISNYFAVATAGAERMRITSAGDVGIGTSNPYKRFSVTKASSTAYSTSDFDIDSLALQLANTTNDKSTGIYFAIGSNGEAAISAVETSDGETALTFGTRGGGSRPERMRITSDGTLLVQQSTRSDTATGMWWRINGAGGAESYFKAIHNSSNAGLAVAYFNRQNNDGTIVGLQQGDIEEGSISVSGSTVSYNGGHLSRWSQLPNGSKDDTILKGTVLTNLDDMCVWTKDGEQLPNEQLNKMKVSDVEGDTNVAGVFVNWTRDDKCNTDDMNVAMTGDMIIRIADGVVVQKGDLLMSAGDGTAKPQGDDIVRSKTVAKVTSNHVTCTYADGSYCVPCVLMAC